MKTQILTVLFAFLVVANTYAQTILSDGDITKQYTYRFIPDISTADSVYKMTLENPGNLPESFGEFYKLQELYIFGNDWDWNFKTLPNSFYNLKNLTKLSISNTDLNFISPEIVNLENLTELDVAGVPLPPEMKNMKRLKVLYVYKLDTIPEIQSLEHLILSFWSDTIKFPVGFDKLINLKKLTINTSSAKYDPDEFKRTIAKLHQLEKLEFQNPYIEANISDEVLMSAFENLKNLKSVNLASIYFHSEAVKYLANVENLTVQGIGCLDDESRKKCYETIANLPELKTYTTSFNKEDVPYYHLFTNLSINHEEWSSLSSIDPDILLLSKIKGLRYLKLQLNSAYLDSLVYVKELDLTRINAVYNLQNLFTELSKMTSLEKLYLSNNLLTEYPEETKLLQQLKVLEISNYQHGMFDAMTDEQKAKLQKMLPNCRIIYNE